MKLRKRILAGVSSLAIAVSSICLSSFTSSAYEFGYSGKVSTEWDFTASAEQKRSLNEDKLVGIGVQLPNWTHRNAIGTTDSWRKETKNVNGDKVGIQKLTGWAYLFNDGYATFTADYNGVELKSSVVGVGPAGIFNEEGQVEKEAVITDAKLDQAGKGTYSASIMGYDFKASVAENKDADQGNGFNMLYLSTTVDYSIDLKLSNIKVRFYDNEKDYREYKLDYFIKKNFEEADSPGASSYGQYMFVDVWNSTYGEDKTAYSSEYYDKRGKDGGLDAFAKFGGASGYSGSESSEWKSGYTGSTLLPSYGIEIVFDAEVPESLVTNTISTTTLKYMIDEIQSIIDGTNVTKIADVAAKNGLTEQEVTEKLTTALTNAKTAYEKYKDVKSASKGSATFVAAKEALDKAVAEAKAVMTELGILVWAELNGAITEAGTLNESDYTADSWAALKTAVDNGNALITKFQNGEEVTQEQIDEAAKAINDAISALVYMDTTGGTTTDGFGYIEFADIDGAYKWYNDGKEYKNVTAATVEVDTSDKGNGKSYTVSAKTADKANGLADCSITIQNLIGLQENAVVTVDSVKLDGEKQELNGVPYTVASGTNAYIPLYDAEVTAIPDDAKTEADGTCAKDASPQALSQGADKDYAALASEWQELEIKFTVNWTSDEEDPAEENENPDTNGGIAVAASLVTIVAAGYVISRKRSK